MLPIVGEEVSARSILLDKIWCWCFRIHVEDRWTVKGVNLIFESIEKKDRGNYTCQATVDGKEHTQSFKLVVISELKCFPSLYVLVHIYIEALAFVSPHPLPPTIHARATMGLLSAVERRRPRRHPFARFCSSSPE
jgi:Immunoglobulin I-set domain